MMKKTMKMMIGLAAMLCAASAMALTEIDLAKDTSGQSPSGDTDYIITGAPSSHAGVEFKLTEGETIRVVIKDATLISGQWGIALKFSGPTTATAYIAFEGTSTLSGHNHGGLKTQGPKLLLESNSGEWATAKLESRYGSIPAVQCEIGGTVALAPGVQSQGDTLEALQSNRSGEIRLQGPNPMVPPEITLVSAKQRWPWNGKVDLVYTVKNLRSDASYRLKVAVKAN